jgi:hypothetical protein
MASQSGSQPAWVWYAEYNQYCWYDSRNDVIHLQDGRRIRRPASVPRSTCETSAAVDYRYQGSPPGQPAYIIAGSNQSRTERVDSVTASSAPRQVSLQNPAAFSAKSAETGENFDELTHRTAALAVNPKGATEQRQQLGSQQTSGRQNVDTQQEDYDDDEEEEYIPGQLEPDIRESGDTRVVNLYDPRNYVRTLYQTAPVQRITDPALLQQGIHAVRMLLRTDGEGEEEQLFDSFRVRDHPHKFFTVGKVFMVLWVEPKGESTKTLDTNIPVLEEGTSTGRYGEKVFSKVRRFVVIREGSNYCSALPIATYGKRGVGKPGVNKSEHAIIYSGKRAPEPLDSEAAARGENGMRPEAIRVDLDDKNDKLDPRSRLDFGKVHTIQHNIKVRYFGQVHKNSMRALINQFGNVWHASPKAVVAQAEVIPGPSSSKGNTARADPSTRRESGSSGQRSQALRSGVASMPEAQGTSTKASKAVETSDDEEQAAGNDDSELQRKQQLFLKKVQQVMDYRKCSREEAIKAVRAALVANQQRQQQQQQQDDEEEDEEENDAAAGAVEEGQVNHEEQQERRPRDQPRSSRSGKNRK